MSNLKSCFHLQFLFLALLGMLSCKDQDAPLSKSREIDFTKLKPAITGKGLPTGNVYTRVIGSAGGVVQSPDGLISVAVPAGALSVNTVIGIQAITNEAPLGAGNAYRLTPEGTVFAKPVKITMKYADGIPAPFVWVVTQKSDGTWLGDRNSEPDESTQTVSVQTTHFSDWAMGRLIDLRLSPGKATLKVKQSLKLNITGFYSREGEEDDLTPLTPIHSKDDDDLAALPDLSAAGRLLVKLNKYSELEFKEWRLDEKKAPTSGSKGKLEAAGSEATYTAPDNVPEQEEVAVSVTVQAKDKKGSSSMVGIVSPIHIVNSEYFLILHLDGKKIEYIPSGNGVKPIDEGLGSVSLKVREGELNLVGQYDTSPEYTHVINLSINDKIVEGKKVYQRDTGRTPYTTLMFTPKERALPVYVNESAKVTYNSNAGCFRSPIHLPIELTLKKTSKDGRNYYEGSFSSKIYFVSATTCQQPEEHTLSGVFYLRGY